MKNNQGISRNTLKFIAITTIDRMEDFGGTCNACADLLYGDGVGCFWSADHHYFGIVFLLWEEWEKE